MAKIKLTTKAGTTYPSDLQNLTYEQAVEQIELLSQKTGFDDLTWEVEAREEDKRDEERV